MSANVLLAAMPVPIRARRGVLVAAGLAGAVIVLVLAGLLGALSGASADLGGSTFDDDAATGETAGDGVSALALREIPALYLRLYEQAGVRYGVDWAILAGIGKVECDHGRAPSPSCTQQGAVNSAGAGGPMQFLASTWATYGVSAEGGGPPNRWNPADAIYSAANYLRASGAPRDYRAAIYAYNHAEWYVEDVKAWAARYSASPQEAGGEGVVGSPAREGAAGSQMGGEGVLGSEGSEALAGADVALAAQTRTPVHFIPGESARLDPEDGHVALIPAGVPAEVQAMLVAGNELQDLPYGPAGHPDPLGASQEDCSSTVNYVLYRAGIRPLSEIVRDNPLAQDYVGWGAPGPGRWVTIYATDAPTPHVFITIAGLRLDTSYEGTDVGPNRFQGGPRWRVLDHIPTWAHWSVRHPPGL